MYAVKVTSRRAWMPSKDLAMPTAARTASSSFPPASGAVPGRHRADRLHVDWLSAVLPGGHDGPTDKMTGVTAIPFGSLPSVAPVNVTVCPRSPLKVAPPMTRSRTIVFSWIPTSA